MPTEKQFDRFLDAVEDIASSLQELAAGGVRVPDITVTHAPQEEEPKAKKKAPKKKKAEKVDEVGEELAKTAEVEDEVAEEKPKKKPAKKEKELTVDDVKKAIRAYMKDDAHTIKEATDLVFENFEVKKVSELTSDQFAPAIELFESEA